MISMHDIFIFFKGIILISIVWLTDIVLLQFASLSIINSDIRSFFVETKDIINWVVSISVLYATYLKIRNEKRKK